MTVTPPLLPWATVNVFGEAVRVKFPNASTVSATVVVAFRVPEVPVMVTVAFPTFAVLLALRVRVLVDVVGFGLNTAVTPVGSPEAAKVTLPENPLTGVTVIVLVPPAPPFAIVRALGEAASVKLWTKGFTVRLIVVEFVNAPETP